MQFLFSCLVNYSLFFDYEKYIFFLYNFVGARLGPTIFCRKMGKVRPMREAIEVKRVCCPPDSAFPLW